MITNNLVQELQYYVGKLCTIITEPIAVPLTNATHSQYFTVRVDSIDTLSIWGTDVNRETKATYLFPIIGIIEEQVITEDDPKYEELKNNIEEKFVSKPVKNKE